jgi:Peptidase_C39 like family
VIRGGLLAGVAVVLALAGAAPATASQPYPVRFDVAPLAAGTKAGTVYSGGALRLATSGLGTRNYADPFGYPARDYLEGGWTGPWLETGLGFTELVSSWNAQTPPGTWIEVQMRARTLKGTLTKWYVMGRWAYGDEDFHRTSVGGQGDADGYIAVDTFFAKDKPMVAYQLGLRLYRAVGTSPTTTPEVTRLGAVASDPVNVKPYSPSATTMGGQTRDLNLPTYSQELHKGEFEEFDGGGEAWCSPTSTAMVMDYWGAGPLPSEYQYVIDKYKDVVDPMVDYTARYVYDYRYQGAGNWPFNTAYAAGRGLESEVTQLRSLAEAEQFIKRGIPLVASVAFSSNKLDNWPFKSTNGHLLIIGGFTGDGDVIGYDPAAPDDSEVHRIYRRDQFEDVWMTATGGIVYVIHPSSVALPPNTPGLPTNW